MKEMKSTKRIAQVVALASSLMLGFAAQASTTQAGPNDSQIQATLNQQLEKKSEFKNVQFTVNNSVVTLTGTVDSLKAKLDAAEKARKSNKNVCEVRNLIEVTPTAPDAELQAKLARSIAYSRVGYGDNPFDVISVSVKDGVVTLSGEVPWAPAREDAVAIVENTKGVKGLVDNVQVLPASLFDDQLRARLFRAIYGDSVLSRYGMDPADPIRILVDNGHVKLYGQVDREQDKEIAGIRANQVFGGFSVENNLTISPNGMAR